MNKIALPLLMMIFLLAGCGGDDPVPTNTVIPATEITFDCQETVESALVMVSEVCETTERNQVCYGNPALRIEAEAESLVFEQPGDIIDLVNVQSISLEPLNTDNGSWGVALMRVQANMPDTLPGQNVTFLLFGDVTMHNEGAQIFYFQSGVGEVSCNQQPGDGILVQTPQTDLDIAFTMNGVDISLAGTAYVQAQAGDNMTVDVIDGQADVTVDDESTVVLAGFQTSVSLDEDGLADAPPEEASPSNTAKLAALPIQTMGNVQSSGSFATPVPPVAGGTNAITLGDDIEGTIDVAGEIDTYTLTLESPQQVMFGGKGSDISTQWRVETVSGELLIENGGMWYGNELGPFDLDAGIYTITVKAEHDEVGTYAFRTWPIPEPQTFSYQIGDIVSEGSVGEGSGLIELPDSKDIYTFTLDTQTDVFFAALGTDTLARWQLETEGGDILFENSRIWGGNHMGVYTLEAGITYKIIVISEFESVGTYEFRLWEQPEPQQFKITVPIVKAGNLDVPGAVDIYTFSIDETQDYYFVAGGADSNMSWQLADEQGNMLFSDKGLWQGNDPGAFELTAGEYTITVTGEVDDIGDYAFEVRAGTE